MELENKQVTVQQEIKKTVARYKPDEIKELIKQDLLERGYIAKDIRFSTDYKSVSDSWGMNSHLVSTFEGAEVEIELS